MTRISFYYDPSCPWCWITSRWLTEVQTEREIEIEWLVLRRLPTLERGLEIWDSLVVIATGPDFYELKRKRARRSKVKTTKRLFPELTDFA